MAQPPSTHEHLAHTDAVKLGSERSFGIVFAVVFAIVALWPLMADGGVRLWAAVVAGLFLALALVAPGILKPLNLLWFKFGMVLHKIVNPLIMGLLFFVTVTPIALLMRALGKRPLALEADASLESYWIERDPPGPDPETMKRQF